MPILVLITRVIFRSTLHFAVARNIIIKVILVEHTDQYHTKFVERSRYLKRRGRKAFVGG